MKNHVITIGPDIRCQVVRLFVLMKLIIFFIIIFFFQTQAKVYSQALTFAKNNTSLMEVFREVNRQTEYRVICQADLLKGLPAIDVNLNNTPLEEALDQLLAPHGLEYVIEKKAVVVRKARGISVNRQTEGLLRPQIQQQEPVTGRVVDEAGQPIGAVSISVPGKNRGTQTNDQGEFTLELSNGDTLLFSSIGYDRHQLIYSGQQRLSVVLTESVQDMDEVVVVAFGTQKKANLTGAVASVNMEALQSRPVAQVGQALQGVVPGLNLNVGGLGGELGQTLGVNIRGTGTIGTGSSASPLILIDGMEGNMNNLNPEDIASISVLKDASSSAIYGSRAAFGVILITTKTGQAGAMRLTYNNNFRYAGPTNLPKQLDSWRFAHYFNDAAANEGTSPVFTNETLGRIRQYIDGEITSTTIRNGDQWHFHQEANDNVDWWKLHFGWDWSNEHNINLNGGSEKLQYYVSSSYLDQNGNLNYGNDTYNRFNATARVNAKVNRFIDFNVNTRFVRFNLDNPLYTDQGGLLYHDIARVWPMMPFMDPNGHYMRNGKLIQLDSGGRAVTSNDNLYGQAELVIRPVPNWNIHVQGGARIINQNKSSSLNPIYEHNYYGLPIALPFTGDYAAGASFASEIYTNSNFFTSSIYSDYTLERNRHYLKGTVGMNTEEFINRSLGARRSDLITPTVPAIGAATGDDFITNASLYDWATAGVFGRVNYAFGDTYLVEVNLRYDGSSRFLSDQRWTLLPSFSLGWNIANEGFFEPLSSMVNMLKPRFSWGKLGNQNTNSIYPFYLSQSVTANAGGWLMDGMRPTVAGVPGMISSFLTWEKVYNTNLGVDMALFNHRLNINYDYFVRETDDMVGPPAEVGAVLGIALPNTNNAKLSNKGWELTANWTDRIGMFRYGIGFNLSDNRVRVLSYPNESMSLSTYYRGMELGEIWGYETEGIARSQQEMDDWLAHTDQQRLGNNWEAGDVMYRDLNNDGQVGPGSNTWDDHGDLKIIGNSNPRYRFGLNLSGAYKGWDFSAFFQGVMKRDLWLDGAMFWGMPGNLWQAVGFEEHLDYFRPDDTESIFGPNVDAYYPKAYMGGRGGKNRYTQTRYLQNGAYIRLKNVQLGYTVPEMRLSRMGIQRLRLFVSAENVWTLSKIADMYDPEVVGGPYSSGKAYPLQSVISFGVNFTL